MVNAGAGADWVDEPCVVHGNLIAARTPADLGPWMKAILAALDAESLDRSHRALDGQASPPRWPNTQAVRRRILAAVVTPSPVRRRIVVEGQVQGVFYRDTCRTEALRAGVSGWARNRPDGAVEVVVEGHAEAVDRLLAWCRSGPAHAVVTSVKVIDEEPEGISGFRVG